MDTGNTARSVTTSHCDVRTGVQEEPAACCVLGHTGIDSTVSTTAHTCAKP